MESFPEHNPKHASHTKPTIEEIKEWDENELLEWIIQKEPKLLRGDKLQKFKDLSIDGVIFLKYGGDKKFFHKECNLPIGTSERLADLASEIAGEETAGEVQKGKEQDTSTEHTADPKTGKRKSLPYTDMAPLPKRIKVGNSSLIINGKLKHFQSGLDNNFSRLLQKEGQAYFDRTRYIFKLHELSTSILFCRPRRFGKSLTLSMLEHFHGLQYAGEHQSLYKGLDVQKDINERKAKNENYVEPGQYFVLKFDFSQIKPSVDLAEANKTLLKFLNCSIEEFYRTYTAYLGGNFADLCQNIEDDDPNYSLQQCAELVQDAINQDERLPSIEGIYVLVDEYDAFLSNYLEPPKTVRGPTISWDDVEAGRTYKSFWATIKSLGAKGIIRRIFITGISPLTLSSFGSAFNVRRNLSFHRDLAGLCGLTYSDLEDALKGICEDPKDYDNFLSEMTKCFNGYHFCNHETVKTVYNTETCLAYLQCCIERVRPNTRNPENSEVSEQFLRRFAASAPVIRDFEEALKRDENGHFIPLKYNLFKSEFTLEDLSGFKCLHSWRSLVVYFGGLTFHPEKPTTHLKIPNSVAEGRIILAVLEKYDLRNSLEEALQHLIDYGELKRTLGVYQELMIQRDVGIKEVTETGEAGHRDSFYFCLLGNPHIVPRAEFQVIKPDLKKGRIDLLFQVHGRLIVTEWKCYRINFLDIQVDGNRYPTVVAKLKTLRDYKLPEILKLSFSASDRYHKGTIESWIMENDGPQLRDYIKSTSVQQLVEKRSLELQAHLVIVVGSRHILLWDMDKEGNLAAEPHLVQVPSRSNKQDGLGDYS